MTLVVGLNFSNKLYLAGDSRVTVTLHDGSTIFVDNITKLVPLWSKGIVEQAFYNNDTLGLAAAGDVAFAKFLFQELQKALNTKQLPSDIRALVTKLQEFLGAATDRWLHDHDYRACGMIISGMSPKRRKKISLDRLEQLKTLFSQHVKRDSAGRDRFLKEIAPTDPTWRQIEEKLKQEAGSSLKEMLEKGDKPTIPSWIEKALSEGSDEIEAPDSLIVGIEIRPRDHILRIETAEWGEFIAYGAGLTKEDLTPDLLAFLELSHTRVANNDNNLMEGAILTTEILETARKRGITTIGGTVILMPTDSTGRLLIQGKDLISNDGPIRVRLGGSEVPLITFHKYPEDPNVQKGLEMSV